MRFYAGSFSRAKNLLKQSRELPTSQHISPVMSTAVDIRKWGARVNMLGARMRIPNEQNRPSTVNGNKETRRTKGGRVWFAGR